MGRALVETGINKARYHGDNGEEYKGIEARWERAYKHAAETGDFLLVLATQEHMKARAANIERRYGREAADAFRKINREASHRVQRRTRIA